MTATVDVGVMDAAYSGQSQYFSTAINIFPPAR